MSIREIIAQNLITLRKRNNLKQTDLAKKINYSDKAISRWENGEVLPDVETLETIAKVYGVSTSYLIEQHDEEEKQNATNRPSKNDVLMHILSLCVVWTIVAIVFVYIQTFKGFAPWQLFLWGIPLSCLYTLIFCRKWNNKVLKIVLGSLLSWSLLACIYLQWLPLNLYLIFLIGLPLQGTIIVSCFTDIRVINIKKNKKK